MFRRVLPGAKGARRDLNAHRALGSDVLEISGTIAVDDKGYSQGIGISRPALLFAYLLRASLAQRGVTIKGKTRTLDARPAESFVGPAPISPLGGDGATRVEIARMPSAPFSLIAAQ